MKSPFKGRHFSSEIILFCVRWYLKSALSYQELSDMLYERGIDVNKSTIWRWIQRYAPELKKRVFQKIKQIQTWHHIDETPIKIKGKWKYLYRAVDHDGNTIDFMLSDHKNLPEAKRFLMQLLSRYHVKKSPKYIVTDKNPAYPSAGVVKICLFEL